MCKIWGMNIVWKLKIEKVSQTSKMKENLHKLLCGKTQQLIRADANPSGTVPISLFTKDLVLWPVLSCYYRYLLFKHIFPWMPLLYCWLSFKNVMRTSTTYQCLMIFLQSTPWNTHFYFRVVETPGKESLDENLVLNTVKDLRWSKWVQEVMKKIENSEKTPKLYLRI